MYGRVDWESEGQAQCPIFDESGEPLNRSTRYHSNRTPRYANGAASRPVAAKT
jgi:hypothetical protein